MISNFGWTIVENVVTISAMCFLVWLTDSGWWALLMLNCYSPKAK